MVRRKHYRPRVSPAEALQELRREAGHQFDARVIEAFDRLLSDAKGHTPL